MHPNQWCISETVDEVNISGTALTDGLDPLSVHCKYTLESGEEYSMLHLYRSQIVFLGYRINVYTVIVLWPSVLILLWSSYIKNNIMLAITCFAATFPVNVTDNKVRCPMESLNENLTLSGYSFDITSNNLLYCNNACIHVIELLK